MHTIKWSLLERTVEEGVLMPRGPCERCACKDFLEQSEGIGKMEWVEGRSVREKWVREGVAASWPTVMGSVLRSG